MFSGDSFYMAVGGMDRALGKKYDQNDLKLNSFDLMDWRRGWTIADNIIRDGGRPSMALSGEHNKQQAKNSDDNKG